MIIKTRITLNQYIRLLMALAYRKPLMIVILFIDLVMILWISGYFLNFLSVPKPVYFQYITVSLISFIQPLFIFIAILRNFQSSNHLKEPLEMEFTAEYIKLTGDSFLTVLKWEKTYKILELKNWYMIYQNNLSAILIDKNNFQPGQEEEFRSLLFSFSGLNLHLKKEIN